ncbi:MAG: alpha/beta hydrolase [Flavobacteriales bacterium]|nr:alpha/beta hydrolase [Flavobacteriales bacterium]
MNGQRAANRYEHNQPISGMAKAVSRALRLIGWKRAFLRKLDSGGYPDAPAAFPFWMRMQYRVSVARQEGRRVWTVAPRGRAGSKVVLYLHGGAYVRNINFFHWLLIGHLVRRTGATVVVPDYPLAPTASHREAHAFVQRTYADLLKQYTPEHIVVMGDSAGGGLALGLAQDLRGQGLPVPARLILIAPWLDVTVSDPVIEALVPLDHMLDVASIRRAGLAYAAGDDPRHPSVSPLFGALHGLPRITLFVGTHDLLLADARALVRQMEAEGHTMDLHEYPGMFHVWVAVTMVPEAKEALSRIAGMVQAG